MSGHAFDFLQSWIVENVNTTMHWDNETATHLANESAWEAKTRGITKADLIDAAGCDLNSYMLTKLNRAVHREVENRVAQDKILTSI